MAKPFIDDVGAFCHIHSSLWSADNDEAVFAPGHDSVMSPLLGHYVAAQATFAQRAFGGEVFDHLVHFFRTEVGVFDHETVTDWELMRYFEHA
jgi:glutamine synthetase